MSTHLAELIFPSTSVIEPTSSLQIHPKTLDTRADNNRVQVVLKFQNYQWIFQDDSAPGTPVRTEKTVER
jgi:hypothetical protein